MQKNHLFANDWLAIHPYKNQQTSDQFFISLSNALLEKTPQILKDTPLYFQKKTAVYVAAYLEDVISNGGLWKAFIAHNKTLYHTFLPFYSTTADYTEDEINREDIYFIIWNTLQKAHYDHAYISPTQPEIYDLGNVFYELLDKVYETAPANELMNGYMYSFENEEEAEHKLDWLFAHTFLTEPSVQAYEIKSEDKYYIPCGPTALCLHEWLQLMKVDDKWKGITLLYPVENELPASLKEKNKEIYQFFTQGTNGEKIVYLKNYDALYHFIIDVLKWPDDENHTLPAMKKHRNFIMMVNEEKGVLLATDICEYIKDPLNPYYNQEEARKHAFSLLTKESVCPPDLLHYLINHHYLPDAQLPGSNQKESWIEKNEDFIARQALGYYYDAD